MTTFVSGQGVRLKARPDVVLTVVGYDKKSEEYELSDEDGGEYYRFAEELEAAPRRLVNGDAVDHPGLANLTFIGWLTIDPELPPRAVCWQMYPIPGNLRGEIRIIRPDEGLTTADEGPIEWGA